MLIVVIFYHRTTVNVRCYVKILKRALRCTECTMHRPIDPVFVCSDFSCSAFSVSTGIHRAAGEDDRHAAESETG